MELEAISIDGQREWMFERGWHREKEREISYFYFYVSSFFFFSFLLLGFRIKLKQNANGLNSFSLYYPNCTCVSFGLIFFNDLKKYGNSKENYFR